MSLSLRTLLGVVFTTMTSTSYAVNVTYSPDKVATSDVEQIRVEFSESMTRVDAPFTVTCDPSLEGFGQWADNNTVWIYNLQVAKNEWGESRGLPGGSSCSLSQAQEIKTAAGAVVKSGTLSYSFTVAGPNVVAVYPVPGFNGQLRETNPVFMVVFDGDVKAETLFNNAGSFLWYPVKSGYPSEKILLAPVSQDREAIFTIMQNEYYMSEWGVTKDSKNWALVTVNQNLIPGADINVSISNVQTAYGSGAVSVESHQELQVREQFAAFVDCTRSSETGPCMPEGSVSIRFNAEVPWSAAQQIVLQYVDAKTGQTVSVNPSSEGVIQEWLGWIGDQLGVSDENAVVSVVDFSARIAAESVATVVFPSGLKDVDGRVLNTDKYALNFGSYGEVIDFAQGLSVMEKNVEGNTGLPIGVMNLNQTLTITKSGTSKNAWTPLTKVSQIIDLIVSYDNSRYEEGYDLFAASGLQFSQEVVSLTGQKNKKQLLSATFAKPKKSGVYVIGIQSSLSEENTTQYGLVLVTDLNVQLKEGSQETLAWVTSYDTGLPVAGAAVTIYGCDKSVVVNGTTDAQGIYKFSRRDMPVCQDGSNYLVSGNNYFVSVATKDDMSLTSNTFTANNSWAMGAPGVDYFYSDVQDEKVLIKPVVGVNLVKPGQSVPVQLVATVPTQKGFRAASADSLPTEVTVTNAAETNVSFTFPLEWKNGSAQFTWNVPQTVMLGLYVLSVQMPGAEWSEMISGGDIEVSEFKVPLMSGRVSLPQGPIVKVDDITVSGLIQYANGVGAKNQNVEVSFYFADAVMNTSEKYASFEFAKGVYTGDNSQTNADKSGLPNSDQVAMIDGLTTNEDGLVQVSLSEKSLDGGQSVGQLLQSVDRPYQLIVRMRYLDQMGEYQTVSTSGTVYNVNTYLGTKVTSGPKDKAQLNVVNLKVDGTVSTSMSDIKAEVYKVAANVISEEIFGGLVKNVFEYELQKTSWVPSCALQAGVLNCAVGALDKGNYVFQVTSKANGQATYSKFSVDAEGIVNGENDYYYFDRNDRSLTLGADKESYKGGDEAKLSFESPYNKCAALVTLERSNVIEAYVDTAACTNEFVKVPVKSELAPNVFASVYLAAGRAKNTELATSFDMGKPSYRIGYSNLKIDWEQYKLNVTVKTDASEYKPAAQAVAEVTVTPEQGMMLGGDVTLVVIEENILTLRPNETYDLLNNLMGLRNHNVSLINNYQMTISSMEAEAAVVAEAETGAVKGGEEGGSGSEFEQSGRKLFDALVTMQTVPVINGKATVAFKLNDKLTKFKVFAIVNDAANKFGTGVTDYVASQELQTVANIPSVTRTGDIFPVSVTMQNNGQQAGTFKAVVEYTIYAADGSVLAQGTMDKGQALESNASQVVRVGDIEIPAGAARASYNVTVYNQNGLVMDRLVDQTQEVKPAVPVSVQEQYMVQMSGASYEQVLTKAAEAVVGVGSIETSVFSSIVESAKTSVESSLSANPFADFAVENQILVALIKSSAQDTQALDKVLAEVVSQVDAQGMIKYYPGSSMGSYWMTSEVVQLIAAKPWALARVPAPLKSRWMRTFESALNGELEAAYLGNSNEAAVVLAAQVKAANVLVSMDSAYDKTSLMNVLASVNAITNLNGLFEETVVDAAVLTAAVDAANARSSKVMKFVTESLLSIKDSSAIIKSKAQYGWWGYSDEIVMTAKIVKAFSAISARSSENRLDNLVKGLVDANRGNQWYTTRTKAWVLNGLAAFAAKFEAQAVTGTTVLATTESSLSSTVVWNQASKENGVVTQWTDDAAKVTVNHNGQGKPWVAITTKAAVPVKGSVSQGFKVTKTVKNVSRQDGTYAAGDLIQVEIKIENPSSISHVGLFDPIPAGANILSEGWGPYNYSQKSYEGYKLYFEYLAEGETTVSYQFQLNNPGTFQMPPTRAEAMYEPGLYGAVENSVMIVK